MTLGQVIYDQLFAKIAPPLWPVYPDARPAPRTTRTSIGCQTAILPVRLLALPRVALIATGLPETGPSSTRWPVSTRTDDYLRRLGGELGRMPLEGTLVNLEWSKGDVVQ